MLSRNSLLALPLLLLFGAALPAQADPAAGAAYRTIDPPVPTTSAGKIEVIEFFSYACPHCNAFYPLVSAWVAKLPHDVVFKRVPVGFGRPQWVALARAYYALQATGDFERLDGALFHALHAESKPLFDDASLTNWVGASGGHAEAFSAAYISMGINTQTVQADLLAENYQIDAVPSLAVAGRYVVRGDSFATMLANADAVIARVRSENKTAHTR